MTIISMLKKTLLTSSLAAMAFGLVGCGPDYALFKVQVRTANNITAADRQPIEQCRMFITDEKGEAVLSNFVLGVDHDSEGRLTRGCGDANTPAYIGDFSYSTSRTSGSLTFNVRAYKNPATDERVLEGSASKEVSKYPPEVELTVELKKP